MPVFVGEGGCEWCEGLEEGRAHVAAEGVEEAEGDTDVDGLFDVDVNTVEFVLFN